MLIHRVNPGQQSFTQTGQGGMPGMPQYQQGGNIPITAVHLQDQKHISK